MKTHWKNFVWLLRREIWEHKGSMVWAPVVVATLCSSQVAFIFWLYRSIPPKVPGPNEFIYDSFAPGTYDIFGVLCFAYFVTALASTFYCINTLADERQDRSVLFWKSLPVSDGLTVWSKVATATLIAPLLSIAATVALAIITYIGVFIANIALPNLSLQQILLQGKFALAPFQILSVLPVYALWSLPTLGWFMMVSAIARSKAFVWAVGLPILSGGLLMWLNRNQGGQLDALNDGFWHNVVERSLTGLVPLSWLRFGNRPPVETTYFATELLQQSWAMLATPALWAGVVVGVAMISVAIRLRRWPLGS